MVKQLTEIAKETPFKVTLGVLMLMGGGLVTGTWASATAFFSMRESFRDMERKIEVVIQHDRSTWTWQMEAQLWDQYFLNGKMGPPDVRAIHERNTN